MSSPLDQHGSRLSAQRAFVVHLATAGRPDRRRFSGRVEHLASGESTRFSSLKGLVKARSVDSSKRTAYACGVRIFRHSARGLFSFSIFPAAALFSPDFSGMVAPSFPKPDAGKRSHPSAAAIPP